MPITALIQRQASRNILNNNCFESGGYYSENICVAVLLSTIKTSWSSFMMGKKVYEADVFVNTFQSLILAVLKNDGVHE